MSSSWRSACGWPAPAPAPGEAAPRGLAGRTGRQRERLAGLGLVILRLEFDTPVAGHDLFEFDDAALGKPRTAEVRRERLCRPAFESFVLERALRVAIGLPRPLGAHESVRSGQRVPEQRVHEVDARIRFLQLAMHAGGDLDHRAGIFTARVFLPGDVRVRGRPRAMRDEQAKAGQDCQRRTNVHGSLAGKWPTKSATRVTARQARLRSAGVRRARPDCR